VACDAAGPAPRNAGPPWHAAWMAAHDAEAAAQAALFRCIFGDPFRPPPAIARAWLSWQAETVLRLARGIYDERAWDRLPILADALDEAGCADPTILGHLRHGGPHARGCHVVDALLTTS
jgi:hypothetical protein